MNIKSMIKAADCGLKVSLGALAGLGVVMLPEMAFAATGGASGAQWNVSSMLNNAGSNSGVGFKADALQSSSIADKVNGVASWIIGLAVIFFVLRVVLTAADRMVFANSNTTFHVPFAYPNPGDERYDENDLKGKQPPEGWTWKRIWLNLAKQIALAAGAWVLVQLVMTLVQFVFSNTISGS